MKTTREVEVETGKIHERPREAEGKNEKFDGKPREAEVSGVQSK